MGCQEQMDEEVVHAFVFPVQLQCALNFILCVLER